jgi:foldase protein PrsA
MKKTLLALTLGVSLTGLTACSLGKDVIVETQAGDITREEFYEKLVKENGAAVLERMIQEKVLKDNYTVTDKEIDAEIKKLKAEFPNEEAFKQNILRGGMIDEKTLRENIAYSLLQKKAVTDGIEVDEKKLKEYYEKNKQMFEVVKAQHILVSDEKKANELKKQLDAGTDFAKLAKEHSLDKGTSPKGGDLGEVKRGELVSDFEEAIFSMKPNSINVVKTQMGYHIVKVTEHKTKSFEEVKTEVKDIYLFDHKKPYDQVIKKLKNKAKVDIKDEELEDEISKLLSSLQKMQQQQQQ